VVALVKALGTDPIRERALLVAGGLSPIAAKSWDDSLAVGYLVTVAAPFLDQIAVLARGAIATVPCATGKPARCWPASCLSQPVSAGCHHSRRPIRSGAGGGDVLGI
jgi:hypothetical protein